MSDKQVREAAVIARQYQAAPPGTWGDLQAVEVAHEVIAEAWLAEHPEDSETLVDVAWLQSVGLINQWYDDAWGSNQYGEEIGIAICVPSGGVMLATNGYITAPKDLVCATRGDVRRLARALRVELGGR